MRPWLQRWAGKQFEPFLTQIPGSILPEITEVLPGLPSIPTLGLPSSLETAIPPLVLPTSGPDADTTFFDDFSTQDRGWATGSDGYGSRQYENGQFALKVTQEDASLDMVPPIQFKPTTIEFDLQIPPEYQEGTLGYYEVVCDYQDASNYHTLAIDPDTNTYSIALFQDGNVQPLTSPDWKDLSAEIPSLRGNPARIMVECAGGSLTLFVNDTFQDQVTETTFTSGDMRIGVSLWKGSPYSDGFKIWIDNLTIFKPAQ